MTAGRDDRVHENLGLVHACAQRFRGRGVEYDDLVQAGCVGLLKAVDRFDGGRGVRFSTYAVPVILGEMRHLFRSGSAVKIGRTLQERARKAMQLTEDFTAREGRSPTISELAAALGVEVAEAAQAVAAGQRPLSLSADGPEGGPMEIPVESEASQIGERMALHQAVDTLSLRDRQLLYLRYGRRETQTVVARRLGMTQVQVSRREKAILGQLRKMLAE